MHRALWKLQDASSDLPDNGCLMSSGKTRLDRSLVEKGFVTTRQRARAVIMAGKVFVDNRPVDKPGALFKKNVEISVKGKDIPYVSRGGIKLEKALQSLGKPVSGLICLDVGASTGGFTDCLLQHGVRHVFAVDVGYGQLAWKLRQNNRVDVIERTNIRHMPAKALPCPVDLITIDVSFISLKIVVPAVIRFMKKDGIILALIKPQFEVGKKLVGKGGVVRDPALHEIIIQQLTDFFMEKGLMRRFVVPSPLLGPKGNREFFIGLKLKS